MSKTLTVGKAGEYRVASELLLRGYKVYLDAIGDTAVDLVLDNGRKIQVKAAHRISAYDKRHPEYTQYNFSFKSWNKESGHYLTHPLKGISHIILWAIDDDIFFILPSKEVRGKFGVRFGLGKRRSWSQYAHFKNNWDCLRVK